MPDQSGIGSGTPETYWVGAISSWGVALVQRGYTVATNAAPLTYNDPFNPYDLSNYDVLIVAEPNTRFGTAAAGQTSLSIFDASGRMVRQLVSSPESAGAHAVRWDGASADGRRSPAGIYWYRLNTRSGAARGKLVLLR